MPVEFEHVETVGGNVVGGTGEGHEEETEHGALKPEVGTQGEGYACQRRSEQYLCQQNPPSFCLYKVDKRTPQRFDNPGQAEPTGVKTNFAIGQAHLHIEHDSNGGYDNIGQTFSDVKGRNPCPG